MANAASSTLNVFLAFLRLGLTSFGGPIAHIGYFREEFVVRRRWLEERTFTDLVALCQFLPGPASSQVGMAIGLSRAGYGGAMAAWVGFTLPSAVVLILFALGLSQHAQWIPSGALHGLKVVAVAVVAQAVWGMARNMCPDAPRITLMLGAAVAALMSASAWTQVGIILLTGAVGAILFRPAQSNGHEALRIPISARTGALWLAAFVALLLILPVLASLTANPVLTRIDAFYRTGSLVFGGGHVVLPLLQAEVVEPGWVSNETFLAGYGATQAVPGPLFSFAAFLGASMQSGPTGWGGGLLYLLAVFLPSFLLIAGALPFWERLRRYRRAQAGMLGVNAGVVGLLLAALYQPVWTSAILDTGDFILALLALAALQWWKLPAWLVVCATAVSGAVMQASN